MNWLSVKPAFPPSSFTLIKRLSSFSSLSAIKMASSIYVRLLMFLLAILIPVCDLSSPAFSITYSAWKSNKQGDNIQSSCSVAQSCLTFCDSMNCSTPGFPVLHYLPVFAQTHVYWVNDAIQPSHPLSPASPPAFNLSKHQDLSQWIGSSHQVAKEWCFSINPSNEYSGLIFFRIDWFDLLAVQRTLESSPAPQFESISSSTFSFFVVQLSHLSVHEKPQLWQ